ncbi:hypothetical protein [Acetobacter senegalensis]|uniref:hypothetical protein n=1 Tax=Acetobacter senegalensis TaxID=446692 RepID=UPI001594A0B6|nr:hypothetical protein [Acetobacter senegalensis]
MTSHEENHAARSEACQPNGVRVVYMGLVLASSAFICTARIIREQRRYRAVVLCQDEHSASYEEWKHKINTVEGLLKPTSNSFGRVRGWLHRFVPCICSAAIHCLSNFRNKIKGFILGFYVCAVGIVKPSNKAFARNLVFWMRNKIGFHKESSPFMFGSKRMMDDGGRYSNVPPNAADAKSSEKQSGVVK